MFLRMKKSADGELVTVPLRRLADGKFTNLSRWGEALSGSHSG